jgi:RimJ/RimL family protein N-acetyltransferase
MRFEPLEAQDKLGRSVILRNAEESDAEELIRYMKVTAGETPFLLREPDEVRFTAEEERKFIKSCMDHPRELMLLAVIDGCHVGNCSLMRIGDFRRHKHRCQVAVALYQEYCGAGIGEILLQTVLSQARQAGYEQAELEVVDGNANATFLYRKLGFKEYGRFPHSMKYADGHYADACWMMKQL